jgi:hypothetical protein
MSLRGEDSDGKVQSLCTLFVCLPSLLLLLLAAPATGQTKQRHLAVQKYSEPEALWSELAQAPEGTQEAWYNRAVAYWDSQEDSVNGVLGGYGHVSDDDITESRKFLVKVSKTSLKEAFSKFIAVAPGHSSKMLNWDCAHRDQSICRPWARLDKVF